MSFSRGTTASHVFLYTGWDASTYIFYSAQMYNADKFKDINKDNWYRSSLTGNYLKKNPRHKNEMLASQFFSVNPFTTFGYHNSNPVSSFGTTLQNSTVREVHIKSCKLNYVLCKSCSHWQTRCIRQKLGVETTSDSAATSQTQNLGHPCVPDGSYIGDGTEYSDSLCQLYSDQGSTV